MQQLSNGKRTLAASSDNPGSAAWWCMKAGARKTKGSNESTLTRSHGSKRTKRGAGQGQGARNHAGDGVKEREATVRGKLLSRGL